jgi:uncharacterized membrane protein
MFPNGPPGLALLLLRLSVTITLIVGVSGTFQGRPRWYLWGLIPLGASLCAGFLTPVVSSLAIGVQLLRLITSATNPVWVSVTILNMLALAIIGPGAYSLDALRFGRRRVLLSSDD